MRGLLAGVLFAALPALAQAAQPGLNPAVMAQATAMTNPLGWGPSASFPAYGSAALLSGGTFPLGSLMHPGFQLVPTWLSYQYLQHLTNPYLGGPAAGNPFLKPLLPGFAPAPSSPFTALERSRVPALPWPAFGPPPAAAGHNPFAAHGMAMLGSPLAAPVPAHAMSLPLSTTPWRGPHSWPGGR